MDKSENNLKTPSKENITLKITHNGKTKVRKSYSYIVQYYLDIIRVKDFN